MVYNCLTIFWLVSVGKARVLVAMTGVWRAVVRIRIRWIWTVFHRPLWSGTRSGNSKTDPWIRIGFVRNIWTLTKYVIKDYKKFWKKIFFFFISVIYCRFGTYFFSVATKIVQVGSGSVVNLPPGSWSLIQDYGSADPDPNTVEAWRIWHILATVLRIRIRDPVSFWPLIWDPGFGNRDG